MPTVVETPRPECAELSEGPVVPFMTPVAAAQINAWLESEAANVAANLATYGAVLLRGLEIRGSKKLARVLSAIFGEPLVDYENRSTPRTKKRGKVYTSTEYPPTETIPQHNENAYANAWPMKIGFFCVTPSTTGGATPVADSRRVYAAIDPAVRSEFTARGLKYVRNFGDVDLSWSEVFQTDDRAAVEAYCRRNAIEFEWRGPNALRTSQQLPAVQTHPRTQEPLWFNQAHLFHVSRLPDEHRENLLRLYAPEDLPRNVYFGDGGELPAASLAHIRAAYEREKYAFSWCADDLMLLDNMLFSHGREPYTGERSVLVGMAGAAQI